MFDIEAQLKKLPDKPGVYLMKDINDVVIYVGKAIILKNRVRQYFRSGNHSAKVRAMVEHIASFEYIITDNELEALLLECNLIKKYKPYYNVLLRDDKTYPYIKVTMGDPYPRVMKVRRIINDKARYFGPYTNIAAVNQTLELLTSLYPIRTCSYDMQRAIATKMRPCLEYYIHNCVGPCTGKITPEQYQKVVEPILHFLSGHDEEVIAMLTSKMREAAKQERYEDAARFRDLLQSVRDTMTDQKLSKAEKHNNTDVIALSQMGASACVEVFFIRGGKMIGRENFILDGVGQESPSDLITTFLEQFYLGQTYLPEELLVEHLPNEVEDLSEYLSQLRGSRVQIHKPLKGEKKRLMELVKKNAIEYLQKFVVPKHQRSKQTQTALTDLKRLLELDEVPHRIEAYDISNIQGTDNIGAMVLYVDGKKARHGYRRYKIKTVQGADDPRSMAEVIRRRIPYGNLPDLMLIDGGLTQIQAVKEELANAGVFVEVWGMYKDDHHRTQGLMTEECRFALDRTSAVYRLIAGIQEEVHRYAIAYYRSLHEKRTTRSRLDGITGVGPVKRRALLQHFQTVEAIAQADVATLTKVKGITPKLAETIQKTLKQKEDIHGDGI